MASAKRLDLMAVVTGPQKRRDSLEQLGGEGGDYFGGGEEGFEVEEEGGVLLGR